MPDVNELETIILELLNGKLRALVEVCNCYADREFLAEMLAKEITAQMEEQWKHKILELTESCTPV